MLSVGSQKADIKKTLKFKLQSLFGELSVLVEGDLPSPEMCCPHI